MNFRVGQKVVCVDDRRRRLGYRMDGLISGDVYVIRWAGDVGHPIFGNYLGVRIAGIDRGSDRYCDDLPYAADRFRPLAYPKQSEETDVAMFKRHLANQPVNA